MIWRTLHVRGRGKRNGLLVNALCIGPAASGDLGISTAQLYQYRHAVLA
jgi:hypothetical protein